MKTFLIAGSLSLLTVSAFAQPAPAGRCSLIDGGVASVAPLNQKGPNEQGLHPLSTPLPKGIGDTVADVSFNVQSDGTVGDVKLLCVTTTGRAADAVVAVVKAWKFAVSGNSKTAQPAKVEYRISAAGVIPLNFAPNPGPKQLEG